MCLWFQCCGWQCKYAVAYECLIKVFCILSFAPQWGELRCTTVWHWKVLLLLQTDACVRRSSHSKSLERWQHHGVKSYQCHGEQYVGFFQMISHNSASARKTLWRWTNIHFNALLFLYSKTKNSNNHISQWTRREFWSQVDVKHGGIYKQWNDCCGDLL